MHVGIAIWSLCKTIGGIQRVGVDLAQAMLARGHKVTIFSQNEEGATPLTPIPPEITLCALDLTNYNDPDPANQTNFETAKHKLTNSSIDVLVALFSWDALLLFPALLRDSGIPLLISEHNHPDIINNERWNHRERHACLMAADRIHILLHNFLPRYPDFLHKNITVIPNPVPEISSCSESKIKPTRATRTLLAAGRFVDSHKQFSLLIDAFAMITLKFPDWKLVLCGDGPDANAYKQRIKQKGLGKRVELPGKVSNMAPYYESSEFICIPSRYEGFGLVTVEAHSFGLPAVGFGGCSGVNEVIVHGENGLLAPEMTAESLAEQLSSLMKDEQLRQRLGSKGKEMLFRFAPHRVYDMWESLLLETAKCAGSTQLQKISAPQREEDQCLLVLSEILNREAPFTRYNWRSEKTLKSENKRLKKQITRQSKIKTNLKFCKNIPSKLETSIRNTIKFFIKTQKENT